MYCNVCGSWSYWHSMTPLRHSTTTMSKRPSMVASIQMDVQLLRLSSSLMSIPTTQRFTICGLMVMKLLCTLLLTTIWPPTGRTSPSTVLSKSSTDNERWWLTSERSNTTKLKECVYHNLNCRVITVSKRCVAWIWNTIAPGQRNISFRPVSGRTRWTISRFRTVRSESVQPHHFRMFG